MGALHYIVPITEQHNLQLDEERQLFTEGRWNEELISNTFNEEICDHIKGLGQPRVEEEEWDRAWWMLNDNGKFSVRSAWEVSRPKNDTNK
ncbi:hypothetical protein KY284_012955 [Solanum tuberosum]|nr:hypothetical protein KY284_012955 [Solanum tuberosum]